MPDVHVALAHAPYDVVVEPGLLSEIGQRCKAIGLKGKAALITDSTVGPLYSEKVHKSLGDAGYTISSHQVPSGEASKSFGQLERLCSEMVRAGHDRSSFVIALGGGVVGDLAGFVAAIFYRGIPFVQIPTTIVSLVDSAVGGKTAVNVPEGKNLVGAFHQPELVLADPKTLKTLAPREFKEGFAEAIKHAAIRDEDMLSDLEAHDPTSQEVSSELIARNIAIKARIVEEDEKELTGTRALLNFGHTIGHGIEASVPYGTFLHGEAISLGLRAALYLSVKNAGLAAGKADRINRLLQQYGLPLQLSDEITTEWIIERMMTDKKFAGGTIRFVLLSDIGEAFVSEEITLEKIKEAIEHLRSPCHA